MNENSLADGALLNVLLPRLRLKGCKKEIGHA